MTPFKSKQLAVILSLEMVGVEKFSSFQSIVHFQGDHQLVAPSWTVSVQPASRWMFLRAVNGGLQIVNEFRQQVTYYNSVQIYLCFPSCQM